MPVYSHACYWIYAKFLYIYASLFVNFKIAHYSYLQDNKRISKLPSWSDKETVWGRGCRLGLHSCPEIETTQYGITSRMHAR